MIHVGVDMLTDTAPVSKMVGSKLEELQVLNKRVVFRESDKSDDLSAAIK